MSADVRVGLFLVVAGLGYLFTVWVMALFMARAGRRRDEIDADIEQALTLVRSEPLVDELAVGMFRADLDAWGRS
jgi:hypothetical protein